MYKRFSARIKRISEPVNRRGNSVIKVCYKRIRLVFGKVFVIAFGKIVVKRHNTVTEVFLVNIAVRSVHSKLRYEQMRTVGINIVVVLEKLRNQCRAEKCKRLLLRLLCISCKLYFTAECRCHLLFKRIVYRQPKITCIIIGQKHRSVFRAVILERIRNVSAKVGIHLTRCGITLEPYAK